MNCVFNSFRGEEVKLLAVIGLMHRPDIRSPFTRAPPGVIRVGPKVTEDPIPLCYCFGFDENHIRNEIERTGNTSVPEKVSKLLLEGLCACEERNPSGMCCLGVVNRTTVHLKASMNNQLEAKRAQKV